MFVRGQKPCADCHLWLCVCDHQPVPQIEPAPEPDEDFTAKTWVELQRLAGECRNEWRFVAHPTCSDSAPCRHCGTIRNKHRLINDHLDQLETAALEAAYEEPA